LTAPNQANGQVSVVVDPGWQEEQEVELAVDGGLFLFQQDMSLDEDKKFGIKLCTNPYSIPSEATPFNGEIQLKDRVAASSAVISKKGNFKPLLSVGTGVKCGQVLQALKVKPSVAKGTQRWELNPDAEQWFEEMADECMVSLLFSGTPLPLGYLMGPMPASAPAAVEQQSKAVAVRPPSSAGSLGSRRIPYPRSLAARTNQRCKAGLVACRSSPIPCGRPKGHSAFLDFLGI
jgi:hypothetical protein